jgi:hypothetical protein
MLSFHFGFVTRWQFFWHVCPVRLCSSSYPCVLSATFVRQCCRFSLSLSLSLSLCFCMLCVCVFPNETFSFSLCIYATCFVNVHATVFFGSHVAPVARTTSHTHILGFCCQNGYECTCTGYLMVAGCCDGEIGLSFVGSACWSLCTYIYRHCLLLVADFKFVCELTWGLTHF